MNENDICVRKWTQGRPPDEAEIRNLLTAEGLSFYRWSNGPGDVYTAHSHPFHKVIYVADGSITFGLPATDEQIALLPGDRLDLPPGLVHDAVVGPQGVVCLEAHRS
jgi:quercetin dioxygenase-like cupin family protein